MAQRDGLTRRGCREYPVPEQLDLNRAFHPDLDDLNCEASKPARDQQHVERQNDHASAMPRPRIHRAYLALPHSAKFLKTESNEPESNEPDKTLEPDKTSLALKAWMAIRRRGFFSYYVVERGRPGFVEQIALAGDPGSLGVHRQGVKLDLDRNMLASSYSPPTSLRSSLQQLRQHDHVCRYHDGLTGKIMPERGATLHNMAVVVVSRTYRFLVHMPPPTSAQHVYVQCRDAVVDGHVSMGRLLARCFEQCAARPCTYTYLPRLSDDEEMEHRLSAVDKAGRPINPQMLVLDFAGDCLNYRDTIKAVYILREGARVASFFQHGDHRDVQDASPGRWPACDACDSLWATVDASS